MERRVLTLRHVDILAKNLYCSTKSHHLLTIFHTEEVDNMDEPQTLSRVLEVPDRDDCSVASWDRLPIKIFQWNLTFIL